MIKPKRKSFKRAFRDYVNAILEPHFSAEELTMELHPMFTEYFSRGYFEMSGNKITCSFMNGQRFVFTVEEITDKTK